MGDNEFQDMVYEKLAKLSNKCSDLEQVVRSIDSQDLDQRLRKIENKLDIKVVK